MGDELMDEQEVLAALASVVEPGLEEILPGMTVVDRDLDLGGEVRACLVCIDDEGAPVLVLFTPGKGERPVLACLDALTFARENAELLARHLASGPGATRELQPNARARVVLVAKRFASRVVARLAALGEERVMLLEVRTLQSATGVQSYLVRAEAGGGHPSFGAADPLQNFVGALGEEQQELLRDLLDRMQRMDEEVRTRSTQRSVTWVFRQDELARIDAADGALRGAVPPRSEPHLLRDGADADAFLEAALERYAIRLGLLEEDGLPVVSVPQPAVLREGPILTKEELEAFRD